MQAKKSNTLIVITGPTGSGKTGLSVSLARRLGCDIISADSRQIYRDIPIGTAAPTAEQLSLAKHHFVGSLSLSEQYSAAQYQSDVIDLLPSLWQKNNVQIMCGGSMMYIDAVCNGIDELPSISPRIRQRVMEIYHQLGLYGIRQIIQLLDPETFERTDPDNPRRNIHALEICLQADKPASQLLTGAKAERDFNILKYYIDTPRDILFDRINRRVDEMVRLGIVDEARRVYHLRSLNSLNTVGYKELFAYFDGSMDYDTAIARIGKNTRVYAKKQITWIKKDPQAIPITLSEGKAKILDDVFKHGL